MENFKVSPSISAERLALIRRTERAMRQCGRDVLIRHKRDGFPVVGFEDGKVVITQPEDIVIPPEEE